MSRADELLKMRPDGCLSDLAAERHLAGDLDAAGNAAVERHLGSCPRCGEMLAAMRDAAPLRRPDLAAIHASLEPEPAVSRLLRWAGRPAVLVPAAALVLVIIAAPFVMQTMEQTGSVREKGGVGLRFFVKTADGSRPGVSGERLRQGDAIKFAVNSGALGYVMIVNVEDDGRVTRYYPRDGGSAAIEPHREQVLQASIVLDDYRGLERVYAVFSDRPIAFDEVAAAVKKAAGTAGRLDLRTAATLPLPFPQASFLLSKE